MTILEYNISSIHADINECVPSGIGMQGDMACDQVCINTPGSYHCECRSGWSLATDGFTCEGVYC